MKAPIYKILPVIVSLIVCGSSVGQNYLSGPLIWDNAEISILMDPESKQRTSLINKADDCYEDSPIVITDKTKSFAPDMHYYCSIGPYWWPDPEHPGHYINKDGQQNPEVKEYDNRRLNSMIDRCVLLSKAYYVTGEKRYYEAFVRQLKAWFLDRNTFMYPNFAYSQVVPGRNNNKGRSTGIIGAYCLNDLIESIRLVEMRKALPRKVKRGMQSWFGDFARWADEGEFGPSLKKADNNVGLAYDVLLTNMYLFAGNEQRAKEIVDGFYKKRILVQIKEDGSQPAELKRTKAFSYSLYNLAHIIDFCYLARYWYPKYYQDHSERIDKAFSYLGQYVDNTDSFPFQQINGWESSLISYKNQKKRLEKREARVFREIK